MINTLIVNNHQVVRAGLRRLLEIQPDIKIIGEETDGIKALALARETQPDIVLADFLLNGISGFEFAKQLHNTSSQIGILFFSLFIGEHFVLEAFRVGVRGYLSQESSSDEVLRAIREVASGHYVLISTILDRTINTFLKMEQSLSDPLRPLTKREREVLYYLAQQNTCKEIATKLLVSRKTIEAQRSSVIRKLGLKNQRELMRFIVEKDFLPAEG